MHVHSNVRSCALAIIYSAFLKEFERVSTYESIATLQSDLIFKKSISQQQQTPARL